MIVASITYAQLLAHQLERSLLRLESLREQLLDRLQARRVLLLANNTPLLGLHEVALCQSTGSVLRRSVPNLALGSRSYHRATHHIILTILASADHFTYSKTRENKLVHGKSGRLAIIDPIHQILHFTRVIDSSKMNEKIAMFPLGFLVEAHQIRIKTLVLIGYLD